MATLYFAGNQVALFNSVDDDDGETEFDATFVFQPDDVIELVIRDSDIDANGELDHSEVVYESITVVRDGVRHEFTIDSGSKIKESGGGGNKEQGDTFISTNDPPNPPASGPFAGLSSDNWVFALDHTFEVGEDTEITQVQSQDLNDDGDTSDSGESGNGNFNVTRALSPPDSPIITDATDGIDNGDIIGTANSESIFGGMSETDPDAGVVDDDSIQGGAGNDTIYAGTGADEIDAGDHSDIVYAGDGADSIDAGSGYDTVYGGAGSDTLDGGAGADTFYGGDGDDQIVLDAEGELVFGGSGNDTFVLGGGDGTLFGGTGSDTFLLSVADYSDLGSSDEVHQALLDLNLIGNENWQAAKGHDPSAGESDTGNASNINVDLIGNEVENSLKWVIGDEAAQDAEDLVETAVQDFLDQNGSNLIQPQDISDVTYQVLEPELGFILAGLASTTVYYKANEQLGTTDSSDQTAATLEDDILARAIHDEIEDFEFGTDVLDLSAHDYLGGAGLSTNDVSVTDTAGDGTGDAVLTFPNGSTVTLKGISVYDLDPEALESMGFNASDDATAFQNAFLTDAGNIGGGGGEDQITGSATDESLSGGAGNDTIVLGGGSDTVQGGDDQDQIVVADGFDGSAIDGGSGGTDSDELDFSELTSGITVSATVADDGTLEDGAGSTGTFADVEDFTGTAFDDEITTGTGANSVDAGAGNDSIDGGTGDDLLVGGLGNDTASGGDGSDLIYGGEGDDRLSTGVGEDTLFGGAGNDVLTNSAGNDTLFGGTGDDTLVASAGDDLLYGGSGNDALSGGEDDDTIYGGDGVDGINGGTGIDTIFGEAGNDAIGAGAGADLVYGGDGVDNMGGGSGDDTLYGDAGDDAFGGDAGNDTLFGGAGNDGMAGSTGNDTIFGGTGNDGVGGGSGNDIIYGGNGSDGMGGDAGADTIYGDDGDDDLGGGDDSDVVYGGADNDTVKGEAGDDTVFGGVGNDTLRGGDGADSIDGGVGTDTLDYSDADGAVTVNLGSGAASGSYASGDTFTNVENVTGSAFNDMITGDTGINTLAGGDGADTFVVEDGSGNDSIDGGSGGLDDDTVDLSGLSNAVTITFTSHEAGVVTDGTDDISFSDVENIVLTSGNDILNGAAGNDQVEGGVGDDILNGGTGNDSIDGGDGADSLRFSNSFGNDTISGGAGTDTLDFSGLSTNAVTVNFTGDQTGTATDGASTVSFSETEIYVLSNQDDVLYGGASSLNLYAGSGSDLIYGSSTTDGLTTGGGDDTVYGGEGLNNIRLNSGNDTAYGGSSTDWFQGDEGDDLLYGGGGSDTFYLEDNFGDDTIVGGEDPGDGDIDVLNIAFFSGSVTITANGDESGTVSSGGDTVQFSEIESVVATASDDLLNFSAASTDLILDAGSGDDVVGGGAANDTLTGGTGNDTFVLSGGDDSVTDFGAGDDQIDSSALSDVGNVLTDQDGTVTADEVTVSGGGGSDQVLTFPSGETVTVPDGTVDTSSQQAQFASLVAMGVPACFAPGTLVLTDQGEVPVEELWPGDMIVTADRGLQTLRWIGRREQFFDSRDDKHRPIQIKRGALSNGLPRRDLIVSPQHRMVISGPAVRAAFGEEDVLALAKGLTGLDGVRVMRGKTQITYYVLLFDRHEIIFAEGAPTESFRPGPTALADFAPEHREQVYTVYPGLREHRIDALGPPVRRILKRREATDFIRRQHASSGTEMETRRRMYEFKKWDSDLEREKCAFNLRISDEVGN